MNLKKLLLWLLPWYRVFGMYKIGSVSLALLIFTPMLLVMVIKKKQLNIDKSLIVLFAITMLVQLFQMAMPDINVSVTWHNMLMDTIFLLTIICAANYVKLEELMKPYMFACAIFIAGMFYQVFQLYVLRIPLGGPIVLFPGLLGEENISTGFDIIRPMSFFPEPQGFATFISLFLIIMLEEKKYIWAVVATLSILLSTSTEGLALLAVIWSFFIVFSKASIFVRIISIIAILVGANYYMALEYFEVGYNKLVDTEYEESVRLVNAFRMLQKFDFNQWLSGVGTTDNAFYRSYIVSMGGAEGFKYVSSALGVFVHYGFFVGVAFWIFLFKKVVFRYRSVFIYSMCLLVIPFAQSCFFSSNFVYLCVLYYLLLDHCKEKEQKNSLLINTANETIN